MKVLITGMSESGKSTILASLAKARCRVVELDEDGWSRWVQCEGNPTGAKPGYDWVWDEDRLFALLAEAAAEPLYVGGCAPNMGRFRALFDRILLLRASAEVLLARVAVRPNNTYGKTQTEMDRIVANLREVEPALRRIATHEIDADQRFDLVLEAVMSAAK